MIGDERNGFMQGRSWSALLDCDRRSPTSHDNHTYDLNGVAAKPRTSDHLGLLESDMQGRLRDAGDQ